MPHALQWQFRVNELVCAVPAVGVWPPSYTAEALSQAQVWHIKESLKGSGSWTDAEGNATTPTNNWIVRSSGNGAGTFGNDDGQDHWVTPANLIANSGANPRSWIVLAQPGIATNYELCISLQAGAAQQYNPMVVVSPNKRFGAVGGGADGTNTSRPTALDEIVVLNSTACGVMNHINGACRIHVLKSATGSATRILITRAMNPVGYWAFEKPSNVPASWDQPSVAFVVGTSTTNQTSPFITPQVIFRAAGGGNFKGRSRAYPNGAAFVAQADAPSGWAFAAQDNWVANESDGSIPFYPNQLVTTGQVPGTRGTWGSMQDFYYAPEGFQPSYVSPDGDWLVAWPMVIPWNKSVPLFY